MRRYPFIFAAWALGWIVYVAVAVSTAYDGLPSVIFLPVIAAIFSAVFVGAGWVLGLIFRIPKLGNLWRYTWLLPASLAVLSLYFMIYGYSLGIQQTLTDPETGNQYTSLRADVFFGCYFLLLFAIVNWPRKKTVNG